MVSDTWWYVSLDWQVSVCGSNYGKVWIGRSVRIKRESLRAQVPTSQHDCSTSGGCRQTCCVDKMLGPTSKAIPVVHDWQDGSILVPHEAIRVMTGPMKRFKLESLPKIEAFSKWYSEIFFPFVTTHHDMEEKHYNPWISDRIAWPAIQSDVTTPHE